MIFLIIIIFISILILYFIPCFITVKYMVGRGTEVPLVDLDLSKTQYAKYEKIVREYNSFFNNIKPELIEIEAYDGIKLKGYYYPNKLNTLIICFHGYRATPLNNYAVMGKKLYEKGYSLLMIIQRGHGLSEGKYTTFADKEKYDCISWINYSKKELNPNKIFLYGMSMGASTILAATSLNMDNIVKGIISDSAFSSSNNACFYGMRRGLKVFAYPLYPGVKLLCVLKGIRGNKIYKQLENNEIPILFIHGKNDKLLPMKEAYNNFNATKGKKELIETEAEHILSIYTDMDLISSKIFKFIENN